MRGASSASDLTLTGCRGNKGRVGLRPDYTPSTAFRHLPPNSARFGHASKVDMVLNVHRNHKAYQGRGEGGRGYGGGGRGRLYTYRYTVTTRMTPVLRWAAMTAILMFD